MNYKHAPVLLEEVIHTFSYLGPRNEAIFLDCTLGLGGHSLAIANSIRQKSKMPIKFIGIDKDSFALELAKESVSKAGLLDSFVFIHDDFKNVTRILNDLNIDKVDGILADLGVSSMQLDNPLRGFSFLNPEQELDMRMDQTASFSAKDVVNGYSKKELEKILKEYGEEKFFRRIAQNIIEFRKNQPIKTIGDMLLIIEKSIPIKLQKEGKIHFATRTFQALRIETNKELEGLGHFIKNIVKKLSLNSKIAIISFHSLEDRIIKQSFTDLAFPCKCPPHMPCVCNNKPILKLENKKPVIATETEIKINPRSRSAKLRVAEKINNG